MATTIKLKNSVTTSNAPISLAQGEVAINVTDKKVWVGNAANTPIQLLGAGGSGSFGALSCTSLTNSGLTTGRVTYSTTGGLQTDSANLTFNGTTLTVNDLTDSSLTVNRVVYAGTGGNLVNSANLFFDGTNLGVGGAASGSYKLEVTGNIYASSGVIQRIVTIADGTSVTINADTTDIATQANTQAAGTLTINAPTGTPVNGQKIMFRLTSTNVQTFSWNSAFAGSTDLSLPAVSSGSGLTDYVGFIYNSTATKWQMIAKVFGF